VGEQGDAERYAQNSAGDKRPDQPRIQPTTDGADRQQLPEQCSEGDQRASQDRFDGPGPYRHRGEAEGKAGEALNKATGHCSKGYVGDEMVQ
jgi:hypothetical protein